MEMNKNIQSLIERACNLQEKLNDEITNRISFCKNCSENGSFCEIEKTPFEERERLIAITDSLKEIEDKLMFLQRLRSWQLINRQVVLNQFEESRCNLIERMSQYQGRQLDVIKELNSYFGDGESSLEWKLKGSAIIENVKRKSSSLLICCHGFICKPWKWKKATGITTKVILISLSISSAIYFRQSKTQYWGTYGNYKAAKITESSTILTNSIRNSCLNVLHGKG